MKLKTINKWLRRIGLVWTVSLYEDGTGDDSKIRIEFWIERASTYDARIPAEGFAVQIHKTDTPEIETKRGYIQTLIPHPEELTVCNEHPPRCLDCEGVVPVESFDAVSFHCRHCDQHVPFCQCETGEATFAAGSCMVCGNEYPSCTCVCDGCNQHKSACRCVFEDGPCPKCGKAWPHCECTMPVDQNIKMTYPPAILDDAVKVNEAGYPGPSAESIISGPWPNPPDPPITSSEFSEGIGGMIGDRMVEERERMACQVCDRIKTDCKCEAFVPYPPTDFVYREHGVSEPIKQVPYLPLSVQCPICRRARTDCKCEGGVSI